MCHAVRILKQFSRAVIAESKASGEAAKSIGVKQADDSSNRAVTREDSTRLALGIRPCPESQTHRSNSHRGPLGCRG